jgi:ABC-type nitrate/sulfonate/bicarbonate transport system substrate-binding protein
MMIKRNTCIVFIFLVLWAMRSVYAAEKVVAGYASVSPSELPFISATSANLFDKYKLDVDIVYMGGSSRVVQAMVSGDINIGHIAGPSVGYARARGIDVVYIATTTNSMVASLMVHQSIKRPEDLRGKRIAVTRRGSLTDFFARIAVEHLGFTPDRDVGFQYTGGMNETFLALSQSITAAAVVGPGPIREMMMQKGYKELLNLAKIGRDFPFNGVATTKRFIKTHKPVVLSFMKAIMEGIKLTIENPEFGKRVLSKYTGVKEDKLLTTGYETYAGYFQKVPYPVTNGWDVVLSMIGREIPQARELKPSDIVDDSIIRELEQSGFVASLGNK